jgi:hypothetical protein
MAISVEDMEWYRGRLCGGRNVGTKYECAMCHMKVSYTWQVCFPVRKKDAQS